VCEHSTHDRERDVDYEAPPARYFCQIFTDCKSDPISDSSYDYEDRVVFGVLF
jgi:hypothetical protein